MDERYAINILPSVQPLSASIIKMDIVAGYNNTP